MVFRVFTARVQLYLPAGVLLRSAQKLSELGRLEDVDVGLLNLARAAASLVDDQPTPSAVKEYAAILTRMMTIGKEVDNDFALLVHQLQADDRNP